MSSDELRRARATADYQFGRGVGEKLFSGDIKIVTSKRTGRIRHVYEGDKLLATFRPKDGLMALTIHGARKLASVLKPPRYRVVVRRDIAEFLKKRPGSLFAKHVIAADPEIRPGEEVIIVNEKDEVVATGRAVLSGDEMLVFKSGVAVKLRK